MDHFGTMFPTMRMISGKPHWTMPRLSIIYAWFNFQVWHFISMNTHYAKVHAHILNYVRMISSIELLMEWSNGHPNYGQHQPWTNLKVIINICCWTSPNGLVAVKTLVETMNKTTTKSKPQPAVKYSKASALSCVTKKWKEPDLFHWLVSTHPPFNQTSKNTDLNALCRSKSCKKTPQKNDTQPPFPMHQT